MFSTRLLACVLASISLVLRAADDAPAPVPSPSDTATAIESGKPNAATPPPAKSKAAAKDTAPPMPPPDLSAQDLPRAAVRVEIFEFPGKGEDAEDPSTSGNDSAPEKKAVAQDSSWSRIPTLKTDESVESAFTFCNIPNKYNEHGVKVDRSSPFLVRAAGVVTFPAGEHRILLRSLTGARVSLDGQPIEATPHLHAKGGDVEQVPDMAEMQLVPGLPLLPPGHKEALATVHGDGQPHVLVIEAFVGGKSIRPEIGELCVAIENGASWEMLAPGANEQPFTESSLSEFVDRQRENVEHLNATRRYHPAEEAYWQTRHDLARKSVRPAPEPPQTAERHPIDRFIAAKLAAAGAQPAPLTDDAAFLRRVTLDTIGLIPTPDEVTAFLADSAPDKRAKAIDRLLADSRWADRWAPYWQDVLAENPNMLKGTLNNTGPFRWWLRDALADNLPMDRFVTELLSMEGSSQYGGPAGFGIASQNDLPMAAKAQIVSSAFLAMQMKCARCHDAPYHPYDQADLLGLAAMLQRTPVKTPGSSLTQGLSANSHVTVSLKPGEAVDPHWPFSDLPSEPLPGVIRRPDDTREKLAALLTDPRNERFPQVIANRLWKELFGFGIVDPVDDWESARPALPELLQWLGHELATHDYDLKHIARLILTSDAYQRIPTAEGSRQMKSKERLFASPARRRMSAEQIVDSLFQAAGKPFNVEALTQDPEDRQSSKDHGNFGVPRRAWEFIPLSNERDRPALAKPRAQTITDVLVTFGWRESRTEPRSIREEEASVLQPALLANGPFGSRITRLSDDSAFTALALRNQPLEELVSQLFLRVLSRPPTADEVARFTEFLKTDYEQRYTGAAPVPPSAQITKAVSWANHLNPDATRVILEAEKLAKAGDTPSPRLRAEWRERLEDALWALMLSPEFLHLP
jgi:Protein of unknown function (DUF1553)/Protein of unknown function (DUF1549)